MKTISAREFRDAPKKYYKEALKQTVVLRLQGGVGLKLVPVKLKRTLTLEEEESTPNILKEGEKPLEVTEPNSDTTQEPTNEVPKQESQQKEPKSEVKDEASSSEVKGSSILGSSAIEEMLQGKYFPEHYL